MKDYHFDTIIKQLVLVVIGGRVPAYGIPPFCWETRPNGSIKHWQTLLNYLQWVKDMR